MKILIALHNQGDRDLYTLYAKRSNHEVITPTNTSYDRENFNAELDQKPERVLMDVNYGSPASYTDLPILEVNEEMIRRGYDTSKSLMGITALSDLVKQLREQNIPAVDKTEIKKIFAFLL